MKRTRTRTRIRPRTGFRPGARAGVRAGAGAGEVRHWDDGSLDLDAYLARIGHTGDLSPTPATLRALHRAHVTAVPFENLEIVLGRPVLLGVPALQDKLVRRARGGYCYEHSRLFAAVLERLGFGVTALSSRVDMGKGRPEAATHAVLRVATAETARTGQVWLCDAGFGSGPLEPVELADGAGVATGGRAFRLERRASGLGTGEWVLRERRPAGGPGEEWRELHSFAPVPQYPVDWEVGNHYVSTHPDSPFTGRPVALRNGPDVRHRLYGTTLVSTRADGSRRVRELEPHEAPGALAETFGIVLDADDAGTLVTVLERLSADGPRD
ncbi:arylamine N-acetyltransferase [Streptomyces sp. TRM 70361]|uniref:arylamine N-acetyltransferase family protein n=1 Tax=Streptomyces sp. TRM 70361 TaxID=3116553 RepID=UPI002E7C20EF|nr:arylamine N-acetyltransferase [Streptomyces sp. TRM 70361]MEE1938459.1 arylamine N-acetyltransferase [Streptomyces sp. TRM 70361]